MLYYCNYTTANESLKLVIDITYMDDSQLQIKTDVTGIQDSPYAVHEIKTGYGDLSLATHEIQDNPITAYSVFLENQADVTVSETFAYTVNQEHNEHIRYFVFRNRLGGYDTVRTKGVKEIGNSFEHVSGKSIDGIFKTHTANEKTHKTNTGFVNTEYNQYLQEIFESPEVYELEEGKLYTVVILNKKTTESKDGQFLYETTIEYMRDINFNDDNNIGDYSPDYSTDYNLY